MRKIQVPLTRYAHPEYLRDLCNRIEACYFSDDRDWSCIEAIFKADLKRMEEREPRPPAADSLDRIRRNRGKLPVDLTAPRRALPAETKRPPKKLIRALSRVADQLARDGRR
jgi:hypothetical protein